MKFINPRELGDSSKYGYTQIVVVPSGSNLVYIAGQTGAVDIENIE